MIEHRLQRLREWMASEHLDGFVISSAANIRYLTGFTGEGLLVVDEELTLCTDSRYVVQAQQEAPGVQVAAEGGGHVGQVAARLSAGKSTRVGFEAEAMTYSTWETLRDKAGGVELVPTRGVIVGQRARKQPEEVELIRRAADLADAAFAQLRPHIRAGVSERELALELHRLMVLGGADGPSFEPIVAGGPNGAKPHARPSARRLAEGDLVVVDWGARAEGYCSDCTRTVAVGELGARQREIWQAVRAAQLAALAVAGPGVPGREVDAAARDHLAGCDLAQYFGHGVGHGVGLEVHERPAVNATSEEVLEPGMVISIEPGVYLDEWGGVRLEELVLITEQGAETLTHAPYDL